MTFDGAGVSLRGWHCQAARSRRATLIYLHGVADNRGSVAGLVDRFTTRGFDVVAYDSRAHGQSSGDACTYGFFEKQDLHRVIDALPAEPIVLFGHSLGAAVALQEAAEDPRVRVMVAAETFSDLRTVATERAPWVFTPWSINRAFQEAKRQAHFDVDAVSPVIAAASIHAPVLLIHGDADADTPAEHSKRVYAALAGPRRLILVPGAHHNQSLQRSVWPDIDQWIERGLAGGEATAN